MSPRTAAGLFVLMVVLWGVNWPVMKVGLDYIPPFHFALLRMTLGAVTMFAVAALAGELRLPVRQDWPIVLSIGLIQMGTFMVLSLLGLRFVGSGRAAILAYTTPLWVLPLSVWVLKERLSGGKIAGFVLGLAGVAVLFNPVGFDWGDRRVLLGNGLLLLGAALWALQIVHVRTHRWVGTPLSLLPWQQTVAVLLLAPLAIMFEPNATIRWTPESIAILAYNGPLTSGLCFWILLTVTRALPAVTTSIGSLATPLVGMLAGAWWLGEPLSATNTGGLALIGGAVAMLVLSEAWSRRA
ncbi:multidrug DMT transporter permease [Immundisolibacter cernigliae]|uniref:Multidrug DMT transporter permease n=1 Tax=Immundisolibacter cernigliae TaxID=1810504 RepID=A0A1B1YXM0_9GAMM|nr:multidrug DMT transporter permease [Immundisolibacter cernigliae]